VTVAAARAGVARETLSRWKANDLVFIAALNSRRAELRDAARAGLRALVGDAVTVLGKMLRAKTTPAPVRRQIAMDILEAGRVASPDSYIGARDATDPERLRLERIRAESDWWRMSELSAGSLPTRLVEPHWSPLSVPAQPPPVEFDPVADLLALIRGQLETQLPRKDTEAPPDDG
jgi:hypothetical protein